MYAAGKRELCGEKLPNGLNENDKLPKPIITPTTKAEVGHDEDISRDEVISMGLVDAATYTKLEYYTHELFKRGTEIAAKQGLILVDTKYEFGTIGDEIILMDEIHTPDSSRYFYAEGYEELQRKKQPQRQLSKEFVRQWLIDHNFMGKEGQQVPDMPDEFVNTITDRYVELYEKVTGEKFVKDERTLDESEIEKAVKGSLGKLAPVASH